jgi:hypothetical protein
MGDIVHQDRAYTLAIVLAIVGMFEEQFQSQGYEMPNRDMEAVMFFIDSCMGGFRGYETVWTDVGALRYDVYSLKRRMITLLSSGPSQAVSRMKRGVGTTI